MGSTCEVVKNMMDIKGLYLLLPILSWSLFPLAIFPSAIFTIHRRKVEACQYSGGGGELIGQVQARIDGKDVSGKYLRTY